MLKTAATSDGPEAMESSDVRGRAAPLDAPGPAEPWDAADRAEPWDAPLGEPWGAEPMRPAPPGPLAEWGDATELQTAWVRLERLGALESGVQPAEAEQVPPPVLAARATGP